MLKPTNLVAVLLSKRGSHYHIGLDCTMVLSPVQGDPYFAFTVNKVDVNHDIFYQGKRYIPCRCIFESIAKYKVR